MARPAEQDNGVQIPNGTAAVNTKGAHLGRKSVTEDSREGCGCRGGCNLLQGYESEDLQSLVLLPFARIRKDAFVAENRPRHLLIKMSNFRSFRASDHTGVGIPFHLRGDCHTSLRTGSQ